MSTAKEDFIRRAVEWLSQQDRSKEEIAEKMYDTASITYDLAKARKRLNDNFFVKAVAELLRPPTL